MAYQFAGFFVATPLSKPESLPPSAAWRDITSPFRGSGVLLPNLVGKVVQPQQVLSLGQDLGITQGTTWLFLQYECWGGEIDFIYGMGAVMGTEYGPVEESARGSVEAAYVQLIGRLGVKPEDALNFAPFERGFWGEQ